MKGIDRNNAAFLIIVLAFCLYAGLFIYRTSFVVNGERYFSLFDDAMVSMQYAKNLASGDGLTWNPGSDPVEGYTNPLWVLLMALFHLLPIPLAKTSLFLQIIGALFLLANLFFVKKMSELISDGSRLVATLAVAMTAFYLSLNYWSLLGMEVSVLVLITTASVWKSVACRKQRKFSAFPYVLLGFAMFIRLDMMVALVGLLSFSIVTDSENRNKHLKFGLLCMASALAIQTGFRYVYYGDLLPNTYYLKMTGFPVLDRITRGLYVFSKFLVNLKLVLFVVPFLILFFNREKHVLLLFWIFILQVSYNIYVGGDAWEHWGGANRFLSIVMPLFFILFCYSLVTLGSVLREKIDQRVQFLSRKVNYLLIGLAAVSMIQFNSIYGYSALKEWLLIKRPFYVSANEKNVKIALILTQVTNEHAKVAVIWGGVLPYFSDRYAIDILGKSDRVIARQPGKGMPGRSRFTNFVPGHSKWDFSHSIGLLEPDVVVGVLPGDPRGAEPYLKRDYRMFRFLGVRLFFKRDTKHIRWEKIDPALEAFS